MIFTLCYLIQYCIELFCVLSFSLKPFYEISIVNPQLHSSKNTKFKAKVVLKELNGVFEVKHNKSFTNISLKVCNLKAITQPQVKESRKCPCKTTLICDREKRMSENVAITHLAECESNTSYGTCCEKLEFFHQILRFAVAVIGDCPRKFLQNA